MSDLKANGGTICVNLYTQYFSHLFKNATKIGVLQFPYILFKRFNIIYIFALLSLYRTVVFCILLCINSDCFSLSLVGLIQFCQFFFFCRKFVSTD